MKKLIILSILTLSAAALAAGGGHGDHGGIPFKEIGWQAANLGILLIALFFLIKGAIVDAFAKRRTQFIDQSEKTKASLKAAELALSDIKSKLNTLETGEKSSVEKAAQEAEALKTSLLNDANIQAQKLKDDTKLIVNAELEKAKAEISAIIMGGAVAATSKKISDKKAQITKDSEAEFLRQIGQVKA